MIPYGVQGCPSSTVSDLTFMGYSVGPAHNQVWTYLHKKISLLPLLNIDVDSNSSVIC